MIIDNNLIVSGASAANVVTGQTVTGASAVLSTNTVDLGQNRDIGQGNELLKARVEAWVWFIASRKAVSSDRRKAAVLPFSSASLTSIWLRASSMPQVSSTCAVVDFDGGTPWLIERQ